jgi:hypothetical protein
MVASVFLQSKRLHGELGPKLEHEEIVQRSKKDTRGGVDNPKVKLS